MPPRQKACTSLPGRITNSPLNFPPSPLSCCEIPNPLKPVRRNSANCDWKQIAPARLTIAGRSRLNSLRIRSLPSRSVCEQEGTATISFSARRTRLPIGYSLRGKRFPTPPRSSSKRSREICSGERRPPNSPGNGVFRSVRPKTRKDLHPLHAMTKITEVAFIAYPVSDINRAREFYENLLGLQPGEFNHELEGMPGKYWIRVRSRQRHVRHIQRLGAIRTERPVRCVRS